MRAPGSRVGQAPGRREHRHRSGARRRPVLAPAHPPHRQRLLDQRPGRLDRPPKGERGILPVTILAGSTPAPAPSAGPGSAGSSGAATGAGARPSLTSSTRKTCPSRGPTVALTTPPSRKLPYTAAGTRHALVLSECPESTAMKWSVLSFPRL